MAEVPRRAVLTAVQTQAPPDHRPAHARASRALRHAPPGARGLATLSLVRRSRRGVLQGSSDVIMLVSGTSGTRWKKSGGEAAARKASGSFRVLSTRPTSLKQVPPPPPQTAQPVSFAHEALRRVCQHGDAPLRPPRRCVRSRRLTTGTARPPGHRACRPATTASEAERAPRDTSRRCRVAGVA
eukprot:559301-Prymnesium_polylepis.1